MKYIGNAFSPSMLDGDSTLTFRMLECKPDLAGLTSAVGHADTAAVLGVEYARINLALKKGDTLIIAMLTGGRLPEGCTTLPDGFSFKFWEVTLS